MRCNKDSTYLWGLLLWYWIPESHSAHWIPVKIRPLLCRKKDIPDYCNIGVFSGHPQNHWNTLLSLYYLWNILKLKMFSGTPMTFFAFLSCIPRRAIPVSIHSLILGKRGTLFSEEQDAIVYMKITGCKGKFSEGTRGKETPVNC